ncbi:YtxH domain-containing protein [Mesonia sp. K7]|uniref:YtxH domain-containing protein n=1 Tax=Mesonia sp. K7 TaxID=2218606 RepID=UPI000DA9BE29|nr:YtxH domain-containing protein [Mesonia sp. K7]PZD77949.1 YtxH domain-containing protein [Mesonia sp. K7]
MKKGNLLAGIASGAVLGAIAGILFAPKKGADTRKQIVDTTNDYADNAKERINRAKSSIENKIEALKAKKDAAMADTKIEELAHNGKAKLHDELA